MASVLCSRTRLVTYLPGIHALVRRVAGTRTRTFAAAGTALSAEPNSSRAPSLTGVWEGSSETPRGLEDPLEQRLQLLTHSDLLWVEEQWSSSRKTLNPDVMLPGCSDEDRRGVCDEGRPAVPRVPSAHPFPGGLGVECAVQSCPRVLKKDFRSMFPEERLSELTVVSVTQRTHNDMTAWSSQVETERLEMLEKFILGASEICSALQKKGFWADFIDPSSGLPFFGAHTNNVLFETDERYRHLGFHIEDLGCCKAIRHPAWGTHVFVGVLFTDAPCGVLTEKLDCD